MTRRVHPLFILMATLTHLRSLVIPIAVLLFNDLKNDGFGFYTMIGVAVVSLVILLFGIVSWYFYTFTIDEQSIRVNKGVFRKSERTTQRQRIESIGINQNVLERLLGLATLTVETSSDSGKPEVELKGVRLDFAKQLKSTIGTGTTQPVLEQEAGETYTVSLTDLLFAGALSGRLGLALVGVGAVYQFVNRFIEQYISQVFNELLHLSLLLLLVIGGAVLFLIYVGSILVFVLRYGSFRATLNKRRMTIGYGLVNRTEVVFHQDKVQALVIEENWIKRRFKRAHLSLHIISASGEEEKLLLHPFIRVADIDHFLKRFLPRFKQLTPEKRAVDRGFFYIVRWPLLSYASLLTVLNGALIYWLPESIRYLGLILFLFLPLYYILARSGYKNTRYGYQNDLFVLRKELVNRETIYAPRLKIEAFSSQVSRFLEEKDILKFQITLRGSSVFQAGYFTQAEFVEVLGWYQQTFLKPIPPSAGTDRSDGEYVEET
ncbi:MULTISPECIES: PH domain-containing protein [Exiguobacterium]|uniref:PH domain-containing protein n=1 Tax=Exiguobacterium antarcticum TaxID=132920 RepID=A0ABT6R3D8_9BACL|nr:MULTISPECIES: PH domain-containing protein [Exiguobacterium]MCT4779989.1 PH domain-containing protein [Exiguobacterium soli]MDI3235459.1 PH domain-containing protein [Exiguobacterium antarcticum]